VKRYLSSPFFLLALLCFFLPFFAITCAGGGIPGLGGGGGGGQELTKVTGVDLITGGAEEDLGDTDEFQPDLPDLGPLGGPTPLPGVSPAAGEGDPVDLGLSQIWAIAAALIALLGIFLALLAGRAGAIMALALGVLGAILMFLLASSVKSSIGDAVGQEAEAFIAVENRIGYWLTLTGFAIAAITGLVRLLMPDRPVGAAPAGFEQPPGAPPAAPPPSPPAAAPPA
jgi:hypothetical protein